MPRVLRYTIQNLVSSYSIDILFGSVNNVGIIYFAQIVAAGANPVQIARGIEKTAKALVGDLRKMSKEVRLG